MTQFLLNMVVALLWLLLTGRPTLVALGIGFLLGFALMVLARPLFPQSRYVSRTWAFVRFWLVFLREFVVANIKVARAVLLLPIDTLRPDYLEYDISDLSPGEAVLLSHCVTLTPGTATVEISDDGRTLVIHALDAGDPEGVRRGITQNLKNRMLEFTR
jgi:multicomponent Na+:H+ antiporter subunit E